MQNQTSHEEFHPGWPTWLTLAGIIVFILYVLLQLARSQPISLGAVAILAGWTFVVGGLYQSYFAWTHDAAEVSAYLRRQNRYAASVALNDPKGESFTHRMNLWMIDAFGETFMLWIMRLLPLLGAGVGVWFMVYGITGFL